MTEITHIGDRALPVSVVFALDGEIMLQALDEIKALAGRVGTKAVIGVSDSLHDGDHTYREMYGFAFDDDGTISEEWHRTPNRRSHHPEEPPKWQDNCLTHGCWDIALKPTDTITQAWLHEDKKIHHVSEDRRYCAPPRPLFPHWPYTELLGDMRRIMEPDENERYVYTRPALVRPLVAELTSGRGHVWQHPALRNLVEVEWGIPMLQEPVYPAGWATPPEETLWQKARGFLSKPHV